MASVCLNVIGLMLLEKSKYLLRCLAGFSMYFTYPSSHLTKSLLLS